MVLYLSWGKSNKLVAQTFTLIRKNGTACFQGPRLGLLKSAVEHSSARYLNCLNFCQSLSKGDLQSKLTCGNHFIFSVPSVSQEHIYTLVLTYVIVNKTMKRA